MKKQNKFFIIAMPIIMAVCSLFLICDYVDAAPRAAVRSAPASRKSTTTQSTNTTTNTTQTNSQQNTETVVDNEPEITDEPELIIENKSSQFDDVVSSVMENATSDNSFAEMIRKQRAALEASEASMNTRNSLKSGKNSCDAMLRQCMMKTCGNDFTKCALDGDTVFGDKLNKCRRDTECSGEEFRLLTTEIKADRDMNVKLASYNDVINCGNQYNACIVNECGITYSKCLGRAAENAAIQKCSVIARECTQSDSGLASRFGNVIGKLRESAEIDIKKDEQRLYELRDLMAKACTSMGAMFDERTFDCVYTVNFYAGENQTTPTASRKRYAGDTFVCMQEWFGINATTYKENAYRETRAQTAASSAMLGSGVGTAVGLVASGAMGRALETQKAKKALKEEEKKQDCEKNGGTWTDGKCSNDTDANKKEKEDKESKNQQKCAEGKELKDGKCVDKDSSEESYKDGDDCTEDAKNTTEDEHANLIKKAVFSNGKCEIISCIDGYTSSADKTKCLQIRADIPEGSEAEEDSESGSGANSASTAKDGDSNNAASSGNEQPAPSEATGTQNEEQFDKIKQCISGIQEKIIVIDKNTNRLFNDCLVAVKTSGFYYVLDDAELNDIDAGDTWGGYYDTCKENGHIHNLSDGIQEYEQDACEFLDRINSFIATHTSCTPSSERKISTDNTGRSFCAQTDIINANYNENTNTNTTKKEPEKKTNTNKDNENGDVSNPKDIDTSQNYSYAVAYRPIDGSKPEDTRCINVKSKRYQSCSIFGVKLNKNEYSLIFDYGYVYGLAQCHDKKCYCTATAFQNSRGSELYQSRNGVSQNLLDDMTIANCEDVCAQDCAIKMGTDGEFRKKVFHDIMTE